ncbi:MAG: hypothetical protein VW338_09460 [Rhodospirillaceae bacterium]
MLTPFKSLTALAVAGMLAGCATPPANVEGYRAVTEADGLAVLAAKAFEGVQPKRAVYADWLIREEYARYEKGGARAEVFYVTPRHENLQYVALNHRHDSTNVAELFNYLTSRPVQSPPGVCARNQLAEFWYRILTLPADGRQCMVFNSEWDLHPEDAVMRPDRVMFGYYCPPAGQSIDKTAASEIIDGLGVRGLNLRHTGATLAVGGLAPAGAQPELAALAKGEGAKGEWGAATFLFDMAAPYSPSRGKDWD